jgi:hypothetical protein
MSNFIAIENALLAGIHGGETKLTGSGEMTVNYGPASGTIKGGGEVTTNNLADCYAMGEKICALPTGTKSVPGTFGGSTQVPYTDPTQQQACLIDRQNACNTTFGGK